MRRAPIPVSAHAAVESFAAAILIASPWIFGFSSNNTAKIVCIAIGAIMLISGALTDWRFSLARLIPLRMHFMTDLLLGLVLVIAPFIFGFSANGGATRFAIIFGALELLTALGTRWDLTDEPARGRSRGTGRPVTR